jgi:hypothetical protein
MPRGSSRLPGRRGVCRQAIAKPRKRSGKPSRRSSAQGCPEVVSAGTIGGIASKTRFLPAARPRGPPKLPGCRGPVILGIAAGLTFPVTPLILFEVVETTTSRNLTISRRLGRRGSFRNDFRTARGRWQRGWWQRRRVRLRCRPSGRELVFRSAAFAHANWLLTIRPQNRCGLSGAGASAAGF